MLIMFEYFQKHLKVFNYYLNNLKFKFDVYFHN